jgi:hypothetical protein
MVLKLRLGSELESGVVYHLHGNSDDSIRKVNGTSIF